MNRTKSNFKMANLGFWRQNRKFTGKINKVQKYTLREWRQHVNLPEACKPALQKRDKRIKE